MWESDVVRGGVLLVEKGIVYTWEGIFEPTEDEEAYQDQQQHRRKLVYILPVHNVLATCQRGKRVRKKETTTVRRKKEATTIQLLQRKLDQKDGAGLQKHLPLRLTYLRLKKEKKKGSTGRRKANGF